MKIKTMPNLMSIIVIIIFIGLSIFGFSYFSFVSALSVKIFLIILGIISGIIGILIALGTFTNYEEVENDKLTIHRFFKSKVIFLNQIGCIEFHGPTIRLMDLENLEIASISTSKANLLALLEYLKNNGIEILNFLEK